MAPRSLHLLPLLALLGACRATPAASPDASPATVTAQPELLRFRVELAAPEDTRNVTLTVRWPEDGGHVRFAGATGLVGNSLCTVGVTGEARGEHARWKVHPATNGTQELEVVAQGPLELELRLERRDGGALSAADLGRGLATSAQADGRPVQASARFEGVRPDVR